LNIKNIIENQNVITSTAIPIVQIKTANTNLTANFPEKKNVKQTKPIVLMVKLIHIFSNLKNDSDDNIINTMKASKTHIRLTLGLNTNEKAKYIIIQNTMVMA
jgi:hypothetical protein